MLGLSVLESLVRNGIVAIAGMIAYGAILEFEISALAGCPCKARTTAAPVAYRAVGVHVSGAGNTGFFELGFLGFNAQGIQRSIECGGFYFGQRSESLGFLRGCRVLTGRLLSGIRRAAGKEGEK